MADKKSYIDKAGGDTTKFFTGAEAEADRQEKPQKPMKKLKKQVFSFRAGIDDIARWKAYSTATGQTMESVGNAAMMEYLENHPLKDNEKVVFDALTANIDK